MIFSIKKKSTFENFKKFEVSKSMEILVEFDIKHLSPKFPSLQTKGVFFDFVYKYSVKREKWPVGENWTKRPTFGMG